MHNNLISDIIWNFNFILTYGESSSTPFLYNTDDMITSTNIYDMITFDMQVIENFVERASSMLYL